MEWNGILNGMWKNEPVLKTRYNGIDMIILYALAEKQLMHMVTTV